MYSGLKLDFIVALIFFLAQLWLLLSYEQAKTDVQRWTVASVLQFASPSQCSQRSWIHMHIIDCEEVQHNHLELRKKITCVCVQHIITGEAVAITSKWTLPNTSSGKMLMIFCEVFCVSMASNRPLKLDTFLLDVLRTKQTNKQKKRTKKKNQNKKPTNVQTVWIVSYFKILFLVLGSHMFWQYLRILQ